LRQAYATLKDEHERQAYNLTLPRNKATSGSLPTLPADSTADSILEDEKDAAALDAIAISKHNISLEWQKIQDEHDNSMLESKKEVQRLRNDVRVFDAKLRYATLEHLWELAKTWCIWILSLIITITGEHLETDEDKERRQRNRLEIIQGRNLKVEALGIKR
jgi:hypothetical protein